MNDTTKDLIVALDIGTSKVVAMIAEVKPNNGLDNTGANLTSFRFSEVGKE